MVGNGTEKMKQSMLRMYSLITFFIPSATTYVWGLRSELNPACKLE